MLWFAASFRHNCQSAPQATEVHWWRHQHSGSKFCLSSFQHSAGIQVCKFQLPWWTQTLAGLRYRQQIWIPFHSSPLLSTRCLIFYCESCSCYFSCRVPKPRKARLFIMKACAFLAWSHTVSRCHTLLDRLSWKLSLLQCRSVCLLNHFSFSFVQWPWHSILACLS